ncbi:MAG: methyltransferase domain-containing protein [Candidatus Dadabacteria bacterium]|nr:methyltransferase domain-containing protein [Candidatus Dadabacteria bacterium]NIQ17171.1 methyltransferase domain-containing protein [Candidatus Dadabacteria bacterium]
MSKSNDFEFGDKSVASSYEEILVPVMFDPWARELINDYPLWNNSRILDLAAGTGIVTRLLSEKIGDDGSIIAVDINSEMLEIAKEKLGNPNSNVIFIESSADSIDQTSNSFDVVVCQQGFQFFPDKLAVAKELKRLLKSDGRAIISTWQPVSECQFFGVICESLEIIDEKEISDLMRKPFDFLGWEELSGYFDDAGFSLVTVDEKKLPLKISGGIDQAIKMAYATPIGPKLRSLDDSKQKQFVNEMSKLLEELTEDGKAYGSLVSNILVAEK